MNVAYVYATNHLFRPTPLPPEFPGSSGRSGTSSINMARALLDEGLIDALEAWRFWSFPPETMLFAGRMPMRWFQSGPDDVGDLERHVASGGPPDVLWVEGPRNPPQLLRILDICRDSFKVLYSQYWKPWQVENLERYDLVLLDEEPHRKRIKKRYPNVRCVVWDKLVDYENGFYPIACEKEYDICYVAELRPRKNHELLVKSMARINQRNLRAVCVGRDYESRMAELESMARGLGVQVEFTGEIPRSDVNAIVNRSRIGVVCAKRDGAPRIIFEYMAANVPSLVHAKLTAGTRYVDERVGVLRLPEEFHLGIEQILDNPNRFSPRAFLLEHYSREQVLSKFVHILEDAGLKLERGSPRTARR